jgi:hypothetical protein
MTGPGTATSVGKIRDGIAVAGEIAFRRAKEGLRYYLQSVVINAQPNPRRFGDCAEPWQRELIGPKVGAFEYLAGLRDSYDGPMSFFDVLARGHDKSSLEGRFATWLLLASRRTIHGYIVAADRDQGRLILQAIEDELRLNPWVASRVKVMKDTVTGPAGDVTVLPADAASAYGLRGNFYVCDEVTHWKNQKMWTAIMSGRQKVNPSVLCVLSNAGLEGSWQHEVFRTVQARARWATFYRKGFLAGWVDHAELKNMMELLPPSEADRLYGNLWIDPAAEHNYLRKAEVDACETPLLKYRPVRQAGVDNYIATLDYGPKRDRSVGCVMHMNRGRVAEIDRMDVWQGRQFDTKEVPVQVIEDWIDTVQRNFNPRLWVADPYQMLGTIQKMEARGLRVERYAARGGAGNFEMAQALRSEVVAGRLAWYPGCGTIEAVDRVTGQVVEETLNTELRKLVVKKMPYGYRFDHERQMHDDRAVAIAMGLVRIADFPFTDVIRAAPLSPTLHRPPEDDRR